MKSNIHIYGGGGGGGGGGVGTMGVQVALRGCR